MTRLIEKFDVLWSWGVTLKQKWLNSYLKSSIFYVKNNEIFLIFCYFMNIELGKYILLLAFFNFWFPLFSKNDPNFCQLVTFSHKKNPLKLANFVYPKMILHNRSIAKYVVGDNFPLINTTKANFIRCFPLCITYGPSCVYVMIIR